MIPVQEARDIILTKAQLLGTERVELFSALGRVLAEDVMSPYDVPPHNNSAMDGYALRSDDLQGASPENPVVFEVIEDLPAGYVSQKMVNPGQAIRIMTGAPIPSGCDTVMRVEDTIRGEGKQVSVLKEVPPLFDVRLAGEDLKTGQVVLEGGKTLRPAEIGLLSSVGRSTVQVYQRAQVAILSTGDELVEVDEPLAPGKIFNSNSYSLAALVLESGGIPIQLGIAQDRREELEEKIAHGLRADMLISSGGVSVGDYDLVKDMLRKSDSAMEFWKVCMKPGKPLAFGNIAGIPTFGLPGNPVSVMVSFEVFVRPTLLKMMGHRQLYRAVVLATLEEDVCKEDERKHFVRVVLRKEQERFIASTTGAQGSGMLSSMSKANGLAVIDEERMTLKVGDTVPVMLLDHSLAHSAERTF